MTNQALNYFLAYGTNAARLAFTPAPPTPAAGPGQVYIWYETDTGAIYAYDTSWHALAGAGTVTSVASGAGLTGGPIVGAGTLAVIIPTLPQGRLTLTSATPVMTVDVTGATTVYYALYNGNYVPIWDGAKFVPTAFTELSQLTTDNTKSPAACAANKNYDMFIWSDSGTIRCTRGPTWSSDTSRGVGAGSSELERKNGIWTNKVAVTNGPGANLGTYVGTIRTNGSSQVDYILGGTGAAGGEQTILGVWNAYNRVHTKLVNFDNTNSWNYTTATMRIKNGNNNNKISMVIGLSEDALTAINSVFVSNTNLNIAFETAIGFNSTTVGSLGNSYTGWWAGTQTFTIPIQAGLCMQAPLGFNYIAPLEYSAAGVGTTTWYGDNGGSEFLSLFYATVNG